MNAGTFCAIPARGGSKRLPRKNLALLAGKPLIAYTIEAALTCIDTVYVCTDDAEIAEAAHHFGAIVPHLVPPDLCGDLVPSHAPCSFLANAVFGDSVAETMTMVCLQPTSPLRSGSYISAALTKFHDENRDFLVSVTPIDPHYFHWAVQEQSDADWRMYFGDRYLMERPLLPPVYRPNGAIKVAKMSALAAHESFFGANMGVIEMPESASVHVADASDFAYCEFLLGL